MYVTIQPFFSKHSLELWNVSTHNTSITMSAWYRAKGQSHWPCNHKSIFIWCTLSPVLPDLIYVNIDKEQYFLLVQCAHFVAGAIIRKKILNAAVLLTLSKTCIKYRILKSLQFTRPQWSMKGKCKSDIGLWWVKVSMFSTFIENVFLCVWKRNVFYLWMSCHGAQNVIQITNAWFSFFCLENAVRSNEELHLTNAM
jgi:hypothetical protein